MKPITISITTFGIEYDHSFAASSIPATLQEQLDEVEVALDAAVTADDYPTATKLSPRQLVATQAELDFKRLTELVNEPSTKPVLVVRLPCAGVCLSLIHISEPTRRHHVSRMPSSA